MSDFPADNIRYDAIGNLSVAHLELDSPFRVALLAIGLGSVDTGLLHGTGELSTPVPAGLPHLLEHCLFHSTSGLAYDTFLDKGYRVHAYTAHSHTGYWVLGGENGPTVLQDLISLAFRAQFTEQHLLHERKVVAHEMRLQTSRAEFRTSRMLRDCLYWHHPIRHADYVTPKQLETIDYSAIMRVHSCAYVPENAVLVLIGHWTTDMSELRNIAEDARPQPLRQVCWEPTHVKVARKTADVVRPRLQVALKGRVSETEGCVLSEEVLLRAVMEWFFGSAGILARDSQLKKIIIAPPTIATSSGLGFATCAASAYVKGNGTSLAEIEGIITGAMPDNHLAPFCEIIRGRLQVELASLYHAPFRLAHFIASCLLSGITLKQYLAIVESITPSEVCRAISKVTDDCRLFLGLT